MIKGDINLYSDTQTRPTPAMREAIATAVVGDEQGGNDPTVNQLCERVAALLGKEAAVFLPSGTMCNEIAILVHCRPGDEIYAHESAHIIHFEGGGPAALSGALVHALPGERGQYTAAALAAAIRGESRYAPRPALVEVEQTANLGGGSVWPLAEIEAVTEVAKRHNLALHMDGARLMNAVVASGVAATDFATSFDSVWLDFTKGLGCPVGAVLAGSAEFIHEAWRWKQRIGGAMRQAGILAAAGLHALDHHVDRLAEDHTNAQCFAAIVTACEGVKLNNGPVETNLVFLDIADTGVAAPALSTALEAEGINIGAFTPTMLRAVTHLDVNREQVETAAHALVAAITRLRT